MEQLLTSKEVTFAALFVALLWWVLQTNEKREKRYLNTIDELSKSLGIVLDLDGAIKVLTEKVDNVLNKFNKKEKDELR